MNEKLKCPKCGHDDYYTKESGKHIKALCAKCDAYIKFLPQSGEPMEIMPFGKYKEWKIVEIDDKQYLDWLLYSSGICTNKRLIASVTKRLNEL